MRSIRLKGLIVLIIILTFSGCSRTRLAYNHLDLFLFWKLDDYISLDNDQKDRVKQQLQFFLQWHRKEQLPRYIQFVEQIQKNTRTKMTAGHFQQHFSTVEGFLNDIMIQTEPDITQLLFQLNWQKQKELFKNISEKQKILEKKYLKLNQEEYRQKRVKRTEKILKRFLGRLTAEQKKTLADWTDSLIPSRKLWLENRRNWQAQFQTLLRKKISNSIKQKELKRLLIHPEQFTSSEYQKTLKQNQLAHFSMLATIQQQLTEKQKKHLKKEWAKIKADLVSLSN
jgi:hypothetical protein